ncbi:hypothetical protein [Gynurincola endophyticus]|uniref:hypothetical protein n=1 Tax=Gynurincola endophyticus TaxID=2479004 RepID=UPI000F8F220C|nr:hypothetical protein [Gynurincola endophyticus]
MKYIFCFITLFTLLDASAQQIPCDSRLIQHQIDSVKDNAKEQGYTIYREALVPMESEYEIPVIAELSNQKIYKYIFIAQPDSRLLETRIFDFDEKQVAYTKKQPLLSDPNIIEIEFIPKFTEKHMLRAVQVHKKKKQLCGYIVLFEIANKEL